MRRACVVAIWAAVIAGPQVAYGQSAGIVETSVQNVEIRQLGFDVQAGRSGPAFQRFEALWRAGGLGRVPGSTFFPAFSLLANGENEGGFYRLVNEISTSPAIAALPKSYQQQLFVTALAHAAQAGETANVPVLLARVDAPNYYLTMLADRKYTAIWPAIEARAGDNLSRIAAEHVDQARRAQAARPEDPALFTQLVDVLYNHGAYEEVVSLTMARLAGRRALLVSEQNDAWWWNYQAFALDALGRRPEADRIFADLTRPRRNQEGWMVNFAINRTERLIGQGRWDRGLVALEMARAMTQYQDVPYARLLVARNRVCALKAVGRASRIESDIRLLQQSFTIDPVIAASGLLCLGMADAAETLLQQAIVQPGPRAIVGQAIQGPRFDPRHLPNVFPDVGKFVLERPALKEAIMRYVRIIPERFAPVGPANRRDLPAVAVPPWQI